MTLVEAAHAIPETRAEIERFLAKIGARGRIDPTHCPESRLRENKLQILHAVQQLDARLLGFSSPAPHQQPAAIGSGMDPELEF